MSIQNSDDIRTALAAPFAAHEVNWKPQVIQKGHGRALAVPYIDARAVAERLDQTVGIARWQDNYTILPGCVVCRLSILVGDEWVGKEGVGSESKQTDAGDRVKAAFSAAFKLAAVKWGIGRSLYTVSKQWCAYDEQKKCFTELPRLPKAALPAKNGADPNTLAASSEQERRHWHTWLIHLLKSDTRQWIDVLRHLNLVGTTRVGELTFAQAEAASLWLTGGREKAPPADWKAAA